MEVAPAKPLVCHDLPVSSNVRFKLKPSPRGWIGYAFLAASPIIIPGLVSLTRPRPVHYTAWGYGLLVVIAGLIALRQVRTATVLEAGGIRMHYTFSNRYLPWSEIVGVEIYERRKVRLAKVLTSSGSVRLPAPLAGGEYDGAQFDAQVAEIAAAWAAANPSAAGAGQPGRSVGPTRTGARRA